GADIVIARFEEPVHIRGELVSRAHLPRETQQHTVDGLFVDGLLTGIDGAEAVLVGASLRDPERIGDWSIYCEKTARSEEPQFIFLDRSAQRHVDVAVRAYPVHGRDAMRFQKWRQVVALQAAALKPGKHGPMQAVAAFLGSHVQPHASSRRLGIAAAGLI